MWITIKEPRTNWILARYDPERGLLEFQRRGVKTLVDLKEIEGEQVNIGGMSISLVTDAAIPKGEVWCASKDASGKPQLTCITNIDAT